MNNDERRAERAAERFGELHGDFDKAFTARASEVSAAARALDPTWIIGWFHERGLCVDAHLHPIVPGEVLIEPLEVQG